MRSSVRVLLSLLPALVLMQFGCKAQPRQAKLLIFDALARQYETVFVADGALLSGAGAFSSVPKDSIGKLQGPFADLIGAVSNTDALKRLDMVAAGSAEVVAVGAKNFRPPAALGDVLSDFCYVLRMSPRFSGDLRRKGPGAQAATVNGSPVWAWKVRTGEPPQEIALYIAQPASGVVLMANDLKGLESTAEQILSARRGVGNLDALPDSQQILSSPVFGYRKYRHDASASSKQASGAMKVSSAAEVLLLFANMSSRALSVRYISGSASDRTAEKISAAARLPKFVPVAPTAWQTSVPLTGGEQIQEQLFTVMSLFGFGVYL